MNTIAPKNTTTYHFTTCKRCGIVIGSEQELCESCMNNTYTSNLSLW